ncbi:GDSL-type esterase/lipase family protein [Actinosynnema mirum]|uniref:Cellulose-binding family II n=1 Tax=Actinosynnema mirum (strain ATCC 29888 / DSM 43827 / JCM 3225 / NBRC 14064 / NCIMB 13271 / NRRL B-12336 / IMRU 3971 / 101) TaxID=446462 RepID=C6WE36_ACTMD|nr:GDSL-type esterase/lipase family protein [Actinosynnema mirum]ACU35779.1 cellulose-binding family II [Actinosynnema mirum DSM 43827]
MTGPDAVKPGVARRAALAAVLSALTLLCGFLITVPTSQAAAAAPVRIMPLGDSITGSPGCWRALLDVDLKAAGYTNIDFVGTLPSQGCGIPHDGDNEGHGGLLVTNVAGQNQLVPWLQATSPDVVVMHFGTNDVWSNIAPATILAAYGKLVDQMRAQNPAMRILIAKLIPMGTPQCADCGQRVVAFNAAIQPWATSKTTAASPIVVVDQWTGFDTATDTYDGVHPNASGDRKIANRWFPVLRDALGGVLPTTTTTGGTTTTTGGTTTTTIPPPTGSCAASVTVVNRWQGGFQADVVFRNTSTVASTAWSVRFSLGGGMSVAQAWNGTATTSGSVATVANAAWNGSVAPAGSATAGIIVNGDPTSWTPSASCTKS